MMKGVFVSIFLLSVLKVESHFLAKRALQKSHEKSQLEKWEDKFLRQVERFDQTESLVQLISKIALDELKDCTVVVLYDVFTETSNDLLLERLFRIFPIPYLHGQITEQYLAKVPKLIVESTTCVNYVLFVKDVMQCKHIIGPQINNKVVIVARSSQWRVHEFLGNEASQIFLNLLELPFILYTHKLYTDALGSSVPQVLTSWRNGSFSTNSVHLFPSKMSRGFAGHRFIITMAQQPPFVIKKGQDYDEEWDGIEIRLVNLLAKMFNFTTDYRECRNWALLGSAEAVIADVKENKANLGIAGLYITDDRIKITDTSYMHSQDCAAFITLTSTALPKYRAIMGPFHWGVWLALTIVYLLAIFPLAFSDKHTLRHIIERPEEMENMFWYVFGTFTNAFNFIGKNSWSKSDKFATRLLIGFYWIFTIIVTACYTGSIIAFVTLPVYPATVDTPEQLISGRYQVGTLNKGGWQHWFVNSTDPVTVKLLKKVDLVPDVSSGLKNITKAFFWPYAFLGSREEFNYIVRTNFITMSKRSLLHTSSQCFVPFGVGLISNKNSLYTKILNTGILRIVQSGIMIKLKKDIEWKMIRSDTGKLLAANSFGSSLRSLVVEDRALTLDDTQGMFLLLGIGFILGGASLLSEWMGGCFNLCKGKRSKSGSTIQSNHRSYQAPTPREKLDSLQYDSLENHQEEIEEAQNNHNCIVHQEDDEEDIENHINKLFDFDEIFGANVDGSQTKEELDENDSS